MSDPIPHFLYRVLPNGDGGWNWEIVDLENGVVQRGIAKDLVQVLTAFVRVQAPLEASKQHAAGLCPNPRNISI
jgi:hypothetical protein